MYSMVCCALGIGNAGVSNEILVTVVMSHVWPIPIAINAYNLKVPGACV